MNITWDDFEKISIHAGTIVSAAPLPKARKPAYMLVIDFGAHGTKQSSAQITGLYQPAELLGKQVLAVLNFPPKNIAGLVSECLVLGVYNENNDVVLLQPERLVQNGCRVG